MSDLEKNLLGEYLVCKANIFCSEMGNMFWPASKMRDTIKRLFPECKLSSFRNVNQHLVSKSVIK